MNHIPTQFLSAEAKPLTRRGLAKLRTRKTVLDAAKRLFTERGYQEATVRDIARAAGMSTGAVFANFTDKADLFNEVVIADYAVLAAHMRQAAAAEEGVEAALLAALTVGYDFHLEQLPLLQAGVSVSWSHGRNEEMRHREGLRDVLAIAEEVLQRAVNRCEVARNMDTTLVADMVWQAYLSNYRLALFDGWDLSRLRNRLSRQIAVVLAGCRV